MNAKLHRYDLDSSNYVSETGTVSVPCPPVFFDANTEQGYIADIKKYPIFAGMEPLFLIQKFVDVVSSNGAGKLKRQWESFTDMNPKAHNTEEFLGYGCAALKWLMLRWIRAVAKAIKKFNAATF